MFYLMSKKKLIYVSYNPLTETLARDWFIEYLISKNITVEYWDLTILLRGEISHARTITPSYVKIFNSYEKLQHAINDPENIGAAYLMLLSYDGRRTRLYRIFSKYDCKMVYIRWAEMPIANVKSRYWKILYKWNQPIELVSELYYVAKAIIFKKLNLIKKFEIVFAAGMYASHNNYARRIVQINYSDFDKYRNASPFFLGEKKRYAVYLDTNLPYHTDLQICGEKGVDPENYYKTLNNFFDLLENKFDLKILIAAHPKANYDSDYFSGREVYYGETPEIVSGCEFVVVEHSTSVSYAVVNYKPIVSIYTDEMKILYRHSTMNWIEGVSQSLASQLLNISDVESLKCVVIPSINQKLYDRYKYNYITSAETERRKSNEIFYHEIVKII